MSEININEETTTETPKNKIAKEIVEYIEIFVFALCFVILTFSFFFRLCTVSGSSMENTLLDKEALIVSDLFYTPERYDIVVAHDTNTLNEPIVKRVIATEGETVNISYSDDTMTVSITDKDGNVSVLEEDYIKYDYQKFYRDQEYTVPEGKVFLMGDNRNDSLDSRSSEVGCVDTRSILGKVVFRITPFSKIGAVK